MPVLRHVGILVWKNLIVLKRSKKWLFFELALGLLFIPYLFIILKVERNTKTNIKIYDPINITGDYRDINRDIPYISPIYSRVCSNETTINIGFAYPNTINDTVMHLFEKRYANEDSRYKVVPHKFNSLKDMRAVLHNISTLMCGNYIGGIYISKLNISARQFSYRIFVPDKGSDWHTNKFWPDGGPYGDSSAKLATFTGIIPQPPPYWTSGFLSFQRALDAIFLEMVGKPTDTPIQLNRFPTPSFQKNGALVLISSFRFFSMSFLFVYRVVGVLLHTTKEIVSEKESGIRTHLLHISLFLIVPFCMVFGIAVVLICILVSVCSRRSSVAIMAILLIWFGMYKLDDYLDLTRTRVKSCFLGSLNVYTAFKLVIHLNWLNMFAESTVSFSIGCAFLMLIVDVFLLLVLIYYFDNVWPTDDSPRKHPLFFLPCIGKPDLAVEFDFIPTHDDDTDSAPYLSIYDEADISVRKVTKIYETGQVAVDGLSFDSYRGQLTVLLGHNGTRLSTIERGQLSRLCQGMNYRKCEESFPLADMDTIPSLP
uniref:ABC transporter domain-containing protein n=1 Tax=Panagrellus redivivus TaxID=6233 RepID=A0A7E4WDV8_PANRE